MSNKALILPQLDKLEKYHFDQWQDLTDVFDSETVPHHAGCLEAVKQFRLMLQGVDVTVDLEVDDERSE